MIPLLQVLLQSSIRATLVALVIGLVLAVARVRSSSLRHTAWLGVLCAMPIMAVLPYVVPPVQAPVPIPSIGREMLESVHEPLPRTEAPAFGPDSVPSVAAAQARPRIVQPGAIGNIVFELYAAGVLALAGRLLAGWLALRKLVRTSTPISGQSAPLYQSPLIATPVTVGITDPKILLPCAWNQWPEEKLRAVLAHELAHLQRRDTVTSLLAHLNRCVFWFHPLAWWLQGKLALTAECVCDDAAIRTIGESRRYAEMLLDMAEAMRRNGRRLSWPAPGFDGTGLLGHRIDRILRGGPVAAVGRSQTLLTAASCALVIFMVAACREKSAPQLREDPALARERTQLKMNAESRRAINQMNGEQAADLERHVNDQPTDLDARKKLMSFYQTSGRKLLGDEKTVESFRAQKLWFIRNHPESECGLLANPLSDPTGYEEERKLWIVVAERKDAPAQAVRNAAQFFSAGDPQLAEKLYLRAQAADPQGRDTRWLGVLYASVLTGPATRSQYAEEVRRKLDQSNDPVLLEWTGLWLERNAGLSNGSSDAAALARSYLERALQLKPDSSQAHVALSMLKQRDRSDRIMRIENFQPFENQYKAAGTIPEADRFQLLPPLAEDAYRRGESLDYYQHDPLGAKAAWELARNYAHNALRLAPKYRNDTNYGTAIYKANMTLGMVAMRVDGDKTAAAKYLLAASKSPANEELEYLVDGLTLKLPVALLRYGGAAEREAVIEFLERYGRVFKRHDLDLLHSAQQLRQGYMPLWYEAQAAQLK
jgi:beta-lactamase regulating signal transducer with metallopeptidase domain